MKFYLFVHTSARLRETTYDQQPVCSLTALLQQLDEKNGMRIAPKHFVICSAELDSDAMQPGNAKYCVSALSYVHNRHERQTEQVRGLQAETCVAQESAQESHLACLRRLGRC